MTAAPHLVVQHPGMQLCGCACLVNMRLVWALQRTVARHQGTITYSFRYDTDPPSDIMYLVSFQTDDAAKACAEDLRQQRFDVR